MDQFKNIIDELSLVAEDIHLLPLCHTTTEGFFMNIYESGNIISEDECPVYHEHLIYFFYGKPSYIVEHEIENITDDPPITFIYDLKDIEEYEIKRILPFDSGGFDRYKFKRGYKKENFSYDTPSLNVIKGMIKLLYQTNEEYLRDHINIANAQDFKKRSWSIKEIIELYDRIKKKQIKVGKQAYSIEIQFDSKKEHDEGIRFTPKYIILPYSFFTSDFWSEKDFSKKYPSITIDYYGETEILESNGNLEAFKYHDLMRQKVLEIIGK